MGSPVMSLHKTLASVTENKICFICDEPGCLQCDQCQQVYFCCNSHGKLHHSDGMCFPYKVDNSDGQRSLVTARDVTMGDILYVEEPIVVGPNHEDECGILRQKNSLLNYHTVLPLRLLLKNSSK